MTPRGIVPPLANAPRRRMLAELTVAATREPFTRRARHELLYCLVGLVIGQIGFAVIGALIIPGTAVSLARGGTVFVLLLLLIVATGGARRLSSAFRRLATRLLGEPIAEAPPLPTSGSISNRAAARLRDATSWRAIAYTLLRPPMSLLELYAIAYWAGLINLTYPFWWRLFRNHPPNTQLGPAPFITPFGEFRVRGFPGTLLVFAVGVATVLAAPWVTRAIVSLDRWLARGLLGPGKLAARVRDLEQTRAHVVDDSAATLRRIERDLHDGTQAQLATLAMNLGHAKDKLEHGSQAPFDPAGALGMVDAAHRQAKEALVELREIARRIHPPALDVGLDSALATLVARSAVPAVLHVDVPSRPTKAIETITYFSAAELLANIAKHSRARHATVEVRAADDLLCLQVTDDGIGGAQLGVGSGLSGLADRIRAVDGHLRISSPPGGPTVVTVDLPLHA
jgi:signal transduction histidine kinase